MNIIKIIADCLPRTGTCTIKIRFEIKNLTCEQRKLICNYINLYLTGLPYCSFQCNEHYAKHTHTHTHFQSLMEIKVAIWESG